MALTQNINYNALSWVRGELQITLTQAEKALTAHASKPDTGEHLALCIQHLHEAIGVCDVVNLSGASMLATEAQAVAKALHKKECPDPIAAQEGLMFSLLVLSSYLQELGETQPDHPLYLLTTLNSLRHLRGERPLLAESLFKPNVLVPLPEWIAPQPEVVVTQSTLQEARVAFMFQHALVGWLRHGEDKDAVQLAKFITQLRLNALQERTVSLWWVAEAVIEAILDKGLSAINSTKLVVSGLRQPVGLQVQQGEQALLNHFPHELLQKLLFLVAQAQSTGSHVTAVKATYALGFFDEKQNQRIYQPDTEAVQQVQESLVTEVQESKGLLLSLESAVPQSREVLAQLSQLMNNIGETLAFVGNLALKKEIETGVMLLKAAEQEERDITKSQLFALANTVIRIEEQAKSKEKRNSDSQALINNEAQQRVITETLIEIAAAKKALGFYISNAGENSASYAEIAQGKLQLAADNIHFVGLSEPAMLLLEIIESLTLDASQLSSEHLDRMAEGISAAEIYLEDKLQGGQPETALLVATMQKLSTMVGEQGSASNVSIAEVSSESALDLKPDADIDIIEAVELEALRSTSVQAYIDNQPQRDQAPIEVSIPEHRVTDEREVSVPGAIDEESRFKSALVPALHVPDDLAREEPIALNDFAADAQDELTTVFLEEAEEIMARLDQELPAWYQQADNERLAGIRRDFHTLKGSGRMVGATVIGELAWAVEGLLNSVLDGTHATTQETQQIVLDTQRVLPSLLTDLAAGGQAETDQTVSLRARIKASIEGRKKEEVQVQGVEDELRDIFIQEATQHLVSLRDSLNMLDTAFFISKPLLRASHSLKGCAKVAAVQPVAVVAQQLDEMLRERYTLQKAFTLPAQQMLETVFGDIENVVSKLKEFDIVSIETAAIESKISTLLNAEVPIEESSFDAAIKLVPTVEATSQERLVDPEIWTAFLDESEDLLAEYIAYAKAWFDKPDNTARSALLENLTELASGAALAGAQSIESVYKQMQLIVQNATAPTATHFELLDHAHEYLYAHVERLNENELPDDIKEFEAEVAALTATPFEEILETEGVLDVDILTPVDNSRVAAVVQEVVTLIAEPEPEENVFLETFVEEAADLLVSSDEAIKRWSSEGDRQAINQLQRDLHTLKGGARLTEVPEMATLAHHMESLILTGFEQDLLGHLNFFPLLQRCQDRLADMQVLLVKREALKAASDLQAAVSAFPERVDVEKPAVVAEKVTRKLNPLPESYAPAKEENTTVDNTQPLDDQIRVRASLLDQLSNSAGEVSISRDRANQQNMLLQQQVSEMEETVDRMQEQLRSVDMEAETQISFRHQQELSEANRDFDPLELDRFTMIQQLSRGLTESASDLNDIRQSIGLLAREMEDILLQQARINTELQHGLMNTRLLPFSGLIPRLERLTRQTSESLDKPVALLVTGEEQELDRTILNRILAPLEHLIRNAIAHGIEPASKRVAQGKASIGRLTLDITHEGAEVVVTLSDDGKGIDLEKVRESAIARGIISATAQLSDDALAQLILTSGISTVDGGASELSGRGIGMDVVSNEIRALRGRLTIHTKAGRGTKFSIHLPLRLSIIQGLIVATSVQPYAIPLNNIHTVIRADMPMITTQLLTANPTVKHGDETYQLFSLNTMLAQPDVLEDIDRQSASLLLFQQQDLNFALLVDGVQGNREIVVKPLGIQLSSIFSINGATVLGDGEIIFILDLPAMVAHEMDVLRLPPEEANIEAAKAKGSAPKVENSVPTVLVVDDSITMRKATGNLLRRQGFNVLTARDGLDAVSVLHEELEAPDIILLDIEMPRMDGYEFATHVRNDETFHDLPIIMITSRDGTKHRDRATAIGVNDYVGKPYQEAQLMEKIHRLIGARYPHLTKPAEK